MTTPALVSAGDIGSAVGSYQPAFGQETAEGNLLLAWVNSNNPASSYPFSTPSGWDLISGGGHGYNWTGLYYKVTPSAGDDTAPTFEDDGYTVTGSIAEFSGLITGSSPLDQWGRTDEGGDATAQAVDSAGGDLIISLVTWNGANTGPFFSVDVTGSDGNPLTVHVMVTNSGGDTPPYYNFAWSIGPGTLGSDENAMSSTITEYEGYPTAAIASFVAAS